MHCLFVFQHQQTSMLRYNVFVHLVKIFIGLFFESSCVYLLSCAAAELWKLVFADRLVLLFRGWLVFGTSRPLFLCV